MKTCEIFDVPIHYYVVKTNRAFPVFHHKQSNVPLKINVNNAPCLLNMVGKSSLDNQINSKSRLYFSSFQLTKKTANLQQKSTSKVIKVPQCQEIPLI